MTDIFTFSLNSISPPNLIHDRNISPVITALDPQLQEISNDTQSLLLIPHIKNLPDNVLDNLALQFHCDFYDLAQSHDMKAAAVSSSLHWHMKKGTASAIIQALKAIGIDAKFIPWWEFGGQPYTFRIKAEITGDFYRGAGKDRITRLITRTINESKSARSLMADLETALNFSEHINIFTANFTGLQGNQILRILQPDKIQHNVIYSSCITDFSGTFAFGVNHINHIDSQILCGSLSFTYWNINTGVEINIMMDLLLQFEDRIRRHFDSSVKSLDEKIDSRFKSVDEKIDYVIELLRWKGDDEEL